MDVHEEWKLPAVVVIIKMINIALLTHFFLLARILKKVIVTPKLIFVYPTHTPFMRQNEVEKSAKIFHVLGKEKERTTKQMSCGNV
jgi:hypothetical protein